jgi:hypothetical protein
MPRWKYQKPKSVNKDDLWIRLELGKPKKLKIHNWEFFNNPEGYSFKCSVTEEDEQAVDKFWTVWDYELKEELKKKLKPFNPDRHKVELIVTKTSDDIEEEFDLQMISKRQ